MTQDVEVAIIGAGQAGLATSWHLKQAGVEHVIFEAGRVAETWRSRRWDSFCLVTPNWSVKLPGAEYAGPDPAGFMDLAELVGHFQTWADRFRAPVRENCPVTALDQDGSGFVLTMNGEKLRARSVVVATGGYQRAHRPAGSDQLPRSLKQLLAEEYSSPGALPEGAVLIVGSGQTGCQLAEEIHQSGRKVFLSCGRCAWAPRRLGDKDFVWWVAQSGYWDRTPDMLPSPAARLGGNFQSTGHGGGHDLHFRVLHAMGVELVGRYLGAEGERLRFADDFAQSVDASDQLAGVFMKWVKALCDKTGMAVPWEVPAPMRIETRQELDVKREGIDTVIWTTGYRPDYRWVHFPVFDELGFPLQVDGRSSVPGLYFMGVHWMRRAKSAVLYGVGEDAEVVATDVAQSRR